MRKWLFLIVPLLVISLGADAQKQRKRPPKQKQITAEQAQKEAAEKKAAQRAEIEGKYSDRLDHHKSIQDKSTQKRMKRNMKRSQKQSWGKDVPWYKRWFRKRRV
ncbi:MAG: hypothetical protein RL220_1846 [Bacteroidota bacterium]|jgi:hypothetical protein